MNHHVAEHRIFDTAPTTSIRPHLQQRPGSASDRRPMKYMLAVLAILAIALGIASVVYGEADDSPGLQLIGVVLIVGTIALGVKTVRSGRR